MNLIVSVDQNWGIGCGGHLLAQAPADFRWFREHTLGKVVVLGRLTLAGFPDSRPLKGRKNIILSADRQFAVSGAETARDLPDLWRALAPYEDEDIYVIGGASVYRLLLPWCAHAYITKFRAVYHADRFFPNLEREPEWVLLEQGEEQEHQGLKFSFCHYLNCAPQPRPR